MVPQRIEHPFYIVLFLSLDYFKLLLIRFIVKIKLCKKLQYEAVIDQFPPLSEVIITTDIILSLTIMFMALLTPTQR